MKKPELLAPAGNLEKLKMAFLYGADAVYIGGEEFGLRAAADNFTMDEMKEGIEFAHERGKKVYVTANIIPHNEDLIEFPQYVKQVYELGADAVIISDPGMFSIVKEIAPGMEIHISTQANNTNWKSVEFWYKLGAKRIVLARELSLAEIKEIRQRIPQDVELECFVHGAMCISYSGRCLLSNYMAARDANRGDCAHPCRWKYYLMEEKRPGQYMPVFENDRGTFIYNSKDLCMIEHIPELVDCGISSFKIEGRVKSAYYVATVVKAYREAIDSYFEKGENYVFDPLWLDELRKVSHRDYTTGFYFGKPSGNEQVYGTSSYIREYDIVGLVKEYDAATGIATVEQRNRFFVGDEIEVIQPGKPFFSQTIEKMWDEQGEPLEVAPHPQMIVKMPMRAPVVPCAMLRKGKV
ncbi:MAG: U32 family peptidase [Clostridiaceae bacterium]|nr:U32 family peptidase [Clostridiaceae bacterium]